MVMRVVLVLHSRQVVVILKHLREPQANSPGELFLRPTDFTASAVERTCSKKGVCWWKASGIIL